MPWQRPYGFQLPKNAASGVPFRRADAVRLIDAADRGHAELAKVAVTKQCDGPTGTIRLVFVSDVTAFHDVTERA